MNFLGGARGSKRLISQNPLPKKVSKKYGLMLRTVENKTEISYFHKVLAISCTIVTRYDLFDSKFEFCD